MRSSLASSLALVLLLAACNGGGAAAAPVPCDVPGGACAAGMLCAHVCDCCGIPPDGGLEPSGHDVCIDDTGQCESNDPFAIEDTTNTCWCLGDGVECPCA